jgi:hypothetical protein
VTDHSGVPWVHLWQILIIASVSNLDQAEQTCGDCCRGEYEEPDRGQYITKEMAIDAGDPSLEGTYF